MPGYIHHVQWCVKDLEVAARSLVEGYQFCLIASREGKNVESVLQSGEICFLLSQRTDDTHPDDLVDCYPWLRCKCRNNPTHEIDSVFNVCLEVADVDKTYKNMTDKGSVILHPLTTITTTEGSIRYAVVTSPCDNVIHSLVNTQDFNGVFLPGFYAPETVSEIRELETSMLTHIDHLTYVVNEGGAAHVLAWYRECCGMERFQITADEEPEVGTVFDDVEIKLNAGDWMSEWLCHEDGVMWQDEQESRNFKLVLAEPLADSTKSHIHR